MVPRGDGGTSAERPRDRLKVASAALGERANSCPRPPTGIPHQPDWPVSEHFESSQWPTGQRVRAPPHIISWSKPLRLAKKAMKDVWPRAAWANLPFVASVASTRTSGAQPRIPTPKSGGTAQAGDRGRRGGGFLRKPIAATALLLPPAIALIVLAGA